MAEKLYDITNELHSVGRMHLSVHRPKEKTENSDIVIYTLHTANYLTFGPIVELAKRGFTTCASQPTKPMSVGYFRIQDVLLSIKNAVEYIKNELKPRKLILMGHSQGGCYMSAYQYIAENGTSRFKNNGRFIPFPDLPELPGGDGLMLLDSNYGIMGVLSMDPGARAYDNGYARIPELDPFNPENGYKPNASEFTEDFISRYQKAQIKMYQDLLDYCKERYDRIQRGLGQFEDDEPLVVAGCHRGSYNNKIFGHDARLLSRTSKSAPLLHKDGTVTSDAIVRTVRPFKDTRSPRNYTSGALTTTVMNILEDEVRFFDDFGYDECNMWGIDGNFNYMSTRENVKYIHVPLLITGNTASHEFVNAEFNFDDAVSKDKELVMVEGATHMFDPLNDSYGDTLGVAADYFTKWLTKPGRFTE